ncbi:uncharacterized protein LOC124136845 [Haliotis rufescens]|uniref:uncharacterized protein LOC124136845 n=1 Tax=Haliotis rufescens TaxID=6454 RepID=UPI00201ED087|nr:uncharacterized protein LOC124136845 [Haliotis rufescens]
MTLLPLTFTMLKIVLIASVVYLAQAQTHTHHAHVTHASHAPHTHPTHTHGTPPPHGNFAFSYDKATGELVMISKTHCYLWALSDAQKMDIHDPAKVEAIEFQLVALASDTTKQTVLTGTHSQDHLLATHCWNKIMVQVAA